MAEILFETKHSDLIESNLFDLMIPFSLIYLKKIMGESLFSSLGSQSKIFSYTIYSKRAARRYQKLISSMDKKEENERRKIFESQKFSAEEKALINVDNGVYYKHLQTLTSRATLIELKFSKISDLSNLENTQNLKIRLEHELFKEIKEEGVVSQPAILLLTRKASHIQRFKYSLMEKYDENIIDMNKKFENKLSKVKKMSKKEAGFQDKVEFNYTPPHNQRTYYDLSSPYN